LASQTTFVTGAALPHESESVSSSSQERGAPLHAVYTNPNPPQRTGAFQRALFHRREPGNVFQLARLDGQRFRSLKRDSGDVMKPAKPRGGARRWVNPNQIVFQFDNASPAMRPFRKELERSREMDAAPLIQRAAAALIDSILVSAFLAVLALSSLVFLRGVSPGELLNAWYILAFVPVIVSLFYKILWALFRKPTIGLQVTGLELRSFDGMPPTFAQLIVRLVAAWLSLACAGLGLVFALVSQDRLPMHDLISQTFLRPARHVESE
jgi:uncharacterized RDD family membrane protein YckC